MNDQREIVSLYKANTSHGVSYPVGFKRAKGSYVFDLEGRKYLDFTSGYGVVNVGWSHSELVRELVKQSRKSQYSIPWMPTREALELSEKLLGYFPRGEYKCIRAVGGADANETAFKIAGLCHPGKKILSFEYSYHGGTARTLAAGDGVRFHFPLQHAEDKAFPQHCLHCVYGKERATCELHCLSEVCRKIESGEYAALIIEPILGSGGVIPFEKEYLEKILHCCRKNGVISIFDEVLTGFGRTGTMFYFQQLSILPDVVTLAKGITSGHAPLGAVVAKKELAEKLEGVYHDVTPTYAWTPVACRVAVKNMEILEKERLPEKAAQNGTYLLGRLKECLEKRSFNTAGLRGQGMMIGLEVSRGTAKASILARKIFLKARWHGLLFCASWNWDELVLLPPLSMSKKEIDLGMSRFTDTLDSLNLR